MPNLFVAGVGSYGTGKDGWVYVALSRVRDLGNLYTLQPLKEKINSYGQRNYVVREDNRLKALALRTNKLFGFKA